MTRLLKFILPLGFVLPAHAREVDRIAAIVNDEIVTASDMRAYKRKLKSDTQSDDLLVPDEKAKDAVLSDDKKLLNTLIDAKILEYEVKKQNLQATIEQVEQEIRGIAERNRIGRAELKQALQAQGTNFAEYQDFIKSQIERQALIKKAVNSRIAISDEEVTSYYVSQKGSASSQTYEYTIAHILFAVRSERDSEAAAKQRAESVLQRLKENKSFETLASQYSDDSRLTSGGRLGTFKANELSPEFLGAIQKLEVGETSGVVKSRAGFHILKLESKHLVADPRLEAEKETIRKHLFEQAFKKQFQFWLDQRRQESIIRINT